MTKRRHWTKEEIEYLEDKWGYLSIPYIAGALKRSTNSVKLKAHKLGLGDARNSTEYVTMYQFTKLSGIPYRTLKAWVKSEGFPCKRKQFYKHKIKMVDLVAFWEWAESHKAMLDLSRFEKGDLGPEPHWADEKRKFDFQTKQYRRKDHNDEWTASEDSQLRFLVEQYKYTYPELAKMLGRGEGAIRRRLDHLGIKARPVRLNNHVKYTEQDMQIILDGIAKGRSFESIAYEIGKSANGVRGKLERMGYKFKRGVPYLPEED